MWKRGARASIQGECESGVKYAEEKERAHKSGHFQLLELPQQKCPTLREGLWLMIQMRGSHMSQLIRAASLAPEPLSSPCLVYTAFNFYLLRKLLPCIIPWPSIKFMAENFPEKPGTWGQCQAEQPLRACGHIYTANPKAKRKQYMLRTALNSRSCPMTGFRVGALWEWSSWGWLSQLQS